MGEWRCSKCGPLPKGMVNMKGSKHICKLCGSDVTWKREV